MDPLTFFNQSSGEPEAFARQSVKHVAGVDVQAVDAKRIGQLPR